MLTVDQCWPRLDWEKYTFFMPCFAEIGISYHNVCWKDFLFLCSNLTKQIRIFSIRKRRYIYSKKCFHWEINLNYISLLLTIEHIVCSNSLLIWVTELLLHLHYCIVLLYYVKFLLLKNCVDLAFLYNFSYY